MLLALGFPLTYHRSGGSIKKKKVNVTHYDCNIMHSIFFFVIIFSFQDKCFILKINS